MRGSHESDVAVVGPQEVDAPGELAPKVVKSLQAHELIRMVRGNYPLDLVALEQRDEDRARTAALVTDEVFAATQDAFGDEEASGGVVKVLSARVRGKAQPIPEKAVCVLWETPSGRTARGAIPYASLTESIDNFDGMAARGEVTEVDATDAKDLQRTVERQEDLIRRQNTKLDEKDAEKDAEIERLREELAKAQEAPPAGDNGGGGEEAKAEPPAPPEPPKVEAPTGKAKELITKARKGEFSAEELDALIEVEKDGDPPRASVIKEAEAAKKKLAGGD